MRSHQPKVALLGLWLCLFALMITFARATSESQRKDPMKKITSMFENLDHDVHEHDRGHDLFDHSIPSVEDFLYKHKIFKHKPFPNPIEKPKPHPNPIEKPKPQPSPIEKPKPFPSPIEKPKPHPSPIEKPSCPTPDDKPKEKPEPEPEPKPKPEPKPEPKLEPPFHSHPFFKKPFFKHPKKPIS